MERNKAELIKDIELLRRKLEHTVQIKKNRTALEVLAISQALDEVINEYYRYHADDPKRTLIRQLYSDS